MAMTVNWYVQRLLVLFAQGEPAAIILDDAEESCPQCNFPNMTLGEQANRRCENCRENYEAAIARNEESEPNCSCVLPAGQYGLCGFHVHDVKVEYSDYTVPAVLTDRFGKPVRCPRWIAWRDRVRIDEKIEQTTESTNRMLYDEKG